jgi:hypothetical protein
MTAAAICELATQRKLVRVMEFERNNETWVERKNEYLAESIFDCELDFVERVGKSLDGTSITLGWVERRRRSWEQELPDAGNFMGTRNPDAGKFIGTRNEPLYFWENVEAVSSRRSVTYVSLSSRVFL